MKILFLSHYSFLYGSNRSLESLILYFKQCGIDVNVLLPSKGSFFQHLQKLGIKVSAFMFLYEVMYVKWYKKYLSLPILWLYDLLAFPILVYKIKRINPDIIYTNSSVDAFSIWVAKLLRKKHIVHIREFMKEDFGASFLFGRKAKRWYLEKSDKLIFVSHAVAQSVVGQIPPNAKVIYNGVKAPKKIKNYSNLSNSLRIGVVGNLDISKQQHVAIKMMKEISAVFPKITLHIIGDKECPYKQYLNELVKEYKLENKVIFDGFVENVDQIYEKFDVLLMCSRSEAFGRVTVEAMQRNIPVIGLDAGGTSELIENGVTGFKYHDTSDIIRALSLIINDPTKAQSIVRSAKDYADLNFSEKVYTQNVYNFVCKLI